MTPGRAGAVAGRGGDPQRAERQESVGDDDGATHEQRRRGGVVRLSLEGEHAGVRQGGEERQAAREPGEEGRVIQRPTGGGVEVPSRGGELRRNSQPVAVHLEVRALVRGDEKKFDRGDENQRARGRRGDHRASRRRRERLRATSRNAGREASAEEMEINNVDDRHEQGRAGQTKNLPRAARW